MSAPTPTPTEIPAEDTSSPSSSATAALTTLTSCMRSIVATDLPYARCVMNSGLFALNETQPDALQRQMRNASSEEGLLMALLRSQFSSDELREASIGSCRLQCTAPSFRVASSCCEATANLHACQLSSTTATTELETCKQALDASVTYSNQECVTLTREDAVLVAVASVFTGIVAIVLCLVWRARRRIQQDETNPVKRSVNGSPTDDRETDSDASDEHPFAAWVHQVRILVWKNLVLRRRRPIALIVEHVVPLFFVAALVVLANLDAIFGRVDEGSVIYRSSDEAATTTDNKLVCIALASLSATDLGAPTGTMRSFYASGQSVLGLFFLLSFIKFVSSMTAAMVHEKEIKMREMVKIMGVSTSAMLVSWSVTNTLLSLPIVLVLAAMLKYGSVFPTAPYALVVLVFWALSVATVAFAYALAPWFKKSRTAAIVSVLLWILLFFPFFSVQPSLGAADKYAGALAPPTAFALAIDRLLREAQLGTGFAFSMTARVQTTAFQGVPTASSMSLFLLLDALVLLVVGWYLEQVLPQQFGSRKPWNFLFTKSYWRPYGEKMVPMIGRSQPTNSQHHHDQNLASPDLFALGSPETAMFASAMSPATNSHTMRTLDTPTVVPIGEAAVIEPVSGELLLQEHTGASLQLRDLTKRFTSKDGDEKLAVDALTLTFYSGQITSLLGHNGAGKTTTIAMLTGLLPPTGGDALLFGRSLRHENDAFRKVMGVCPQHDVLFPDLTVDEHLWFFASIKQIRGRDKTDKLITALLEDVGLLSSRFNLAKNLSGGQKRKLSVAIALLGNSKLVFFDEPTSGMDPYSRRFTWNLLRRKRAGRVLVLTTHFMDEADVLGDRIAILADGQLRCVGSSLFLKNRYGAGYNLTLIKDTQRVVCDVRRIHVFLLQFVADVTLASDSGSELVFTLPTHAAPQFPVLLDALDGHLNELGVRSYGVSVTTLEDVFLRIASDRDTDKQGDSPTAGARSLEPATPMLALDTPSLESPAFAPTHRPPFASQVRTLLRKRWWIAKRDRKSLFNAVGVPLVFLLILAVLPEVQVANFLPDYALTFASSAQQQACPAADLTANVLDMRLYERCTTRWFAFCGTGLIDCDASVCCNSLDYRSPFYACPTCPPTSPTEPEPCYNPTCLRRNGAKLQVALNAFIVAMIVMLAFAFIPAALIAFIVKEKDPTQDAKALQRISGMNTHAYWTANGLYDLGVLVWSVVVAIVAAAVSRPALRSDAAALALLIIAHALCLVPLTYLYARRFSKHATAQTSVLVFTLSSGGLLSIFSFLCRVVDFQMSSSLTLSGLDRDFLRWLFLLFPGYALNNGVYELATRKITRGSLFGSSRNWNPHSSFFGLFRGFGKDLDCPACWSRAVENCCVRESMDFDVVLAPALYMLLEAVVFTVLVLHWENRPPQTTPREWPARLKNAAMRLLHRVTKTSVMVATEGDKLAAPSPEKEQEEEDGDVVQERIRLDHQDDIGDAIELRHLRVQYPDGRVALRDLSLGVARGECFGYLGVNGAGKSTTIKVLTRQITATSGTVRVAGRALGGSPSADAHLIGYCPQFDALHDLLTVEEQLVLYARLKGISPEHIMRQVHALIRQLGLEEYRGKLTRGLSGGNKRKVSTAIALLGAPSIVILDEPSTGMDPSSRRKMWNVIAAACESHKTSVILTTHSMEECEALCSRVGILVQGKLQCLGSIQHLRQKYGKGYTVDLKLDSEPTPEQVEVVDQQVKAVVEGRDASDILTESQVLQLCEALGKADRFALLQESYVKEWWSKDVTRTISAQVLCSWWASRDRNDALLQFLPQTFPGSNLVEQHGDHLRFHVPKALPTGEPLKPKAIFEALEQGKQRFSIEEYSVSDTSLEHIFNRMADDDARRQDRGGQGSGDGSEAYTSESD